MMTMIDGIKQALEKYAGKWNEKKGLWDFSTTIAERKAFLSKKKLTYTLKIRINEDTKTVKFSEMLVEAGSGLSSDSGFSSGFGVKAESYNTFSGPRQGTIEEQSNLFGKEYSYQFDYSEIRSKVKALVEDSGYQFEYQTLPVK